MAKAVLNDLAELVEAGLITPENAVNIQAYYNSKADSSQNRLFVVFGLLGAILVGLGIILIIAHNWDDLSRSVKTIFSFLPLVIGQLICIYVLLKKSLNVAWRESAAAFLFLAIGSSISMISQVYHIPGDISSFIITWMLLGLPLVYILNSGTASLIYILGISYFVIQTGYFESWYNSPDGDGSYKYWFLLALIIPYYYKMVTKNAAANFTVFNNWFIVLSVIVALGTIGENAKHFLWPAYMALFSIIYNLQTTSRYRVRRQAGDFYAIGSLGIISILLIFSFDWIWLSLYKKDFSFSNTLFTPEVISAAILFIIAVLLFSRKKFMVNGNIDPFSILFIPFTAVFLLGMFYEPKAAVILANIMVLASGILLIREGGRMDHLGILNYGLLIIAALVTCRFFDKELSFVIRGIFFQPN